MTFCSIIDCAMNFFKMSASLVAGFMCIFSIYIVNGAPLMNVDVTQQAPATDSADHLSMFKVSEIMDNMRLNDIGAEGGYVVDESLCKSILTILTSSNESETFRSAASNIIDITGNYEAQKTIIRKIAATLQLCQRLEVTEIDIQSLIEKLEKSIFEEIRVETALPLESDEVDEKKCSKVSTNLDDYAFVNSSEDSLKSDHVNMSRSLDDNTPHFISLEETPAAKKTSKGKNAFNWDPFADYSKVSANRERSRKGSKIKNVD